MHAPHAPLSRRFSSALTPLGISLLAAASPLSIGLAHASSEAAIGMATYAEAEAVTFTEAATDASGHDIVVTARRREEKVQDVPIAISVIGQEQLEDTGFVTLQQFQQLVPSMQIFAINPRNTNINIRGLGSNVAVSNDGLEYGVGVYVDNVYYGRPGQSQFELVDLDRIEVLRGPQGTLFGKNTTAGAINITSRLPSFEPEGTFEANFGNYGYHLIRGSVSAPISDNTAIRLSASDNHRDGFIRNTRIGGRVQAADNFSVRGQVLTKPADNLSIRIIGDYSKSNYACCSGIPTGYFPTFSNGAPLNDTIFDQANRLGYTLPEIDPFARTTDIDTPVRVNMKGYGVSGQLDWDFGNIALTSVTSYRGWDWAPTNDNDGTGLPIWTVGITLSKQRQFSQEIRLASTGKNTIDWVAGLYYFWQNLESTGINSFGSAAANWYRAPNSPVPLAAWEAALTGLTSENNAIAKTNSYAAFGQATWNISDALSLTGGLRFTHERKIGSFEQYTTAGADITGNAGANGIRNGYAPVVPLYDVKHTNSNVTGQLTLSYKITPSVLTYASYARGGKSGGLNLAASRPGLVFPKVLKPESVDAYEIGLKSQFWNNAITLNAAAFWTDVSDYQSSISTLFNGSSVQYVENVGTVRSRGVEIDARIAPSRNFSFGGAISYIDATYRSYPNAPAPVEQAGGGTRDLTGHRIAGVSKWNYNVNLATNHPIGGGNSDIELYTYTDYSYRSGYFTNVTNSIYSHVKSYGIVNTRIGLRGDNDLWDVSIFARNLFDKKYFTSNAASNTGRISGNLGDPRTYGVTLRSKF